MAEHPFRLPSEDRELLLDPSPSRWRSEIARNRSLPDAWRFDVGGRSAADVRIEARSELIELAKKFARLGVAGAGTDALGGPDGQGVGTRPIVLTGHQPLLYHPGVWVKAFLAERLAASLGGFAFNTVVDSDSEREIAVDLPARARRAPAAGAKRVDAASSRSGGRRAGRGTGSCAGALERCREVLLDIPDGMPFEAVDKPTETQFEQFCNRAIRHLATLPDDAPLRRFQRFRRSALAVWPLAETVADFLTLARRHFEASSASAASHAGEVPDHRRDEARHGAVVRDVPISALSRGRAFGRFFLDIVWQAECFAATYNDVLADFRRKHNIRSPLHPFPDLRVAPNEVELPFWLLSEDGRRYPLAVRQTDSGRMAIGTAGDAGDFTAWVDGPAPPPGERPGNAWWDEWDALRRTIQIRPKAVPLTLFSRLFLADVFIHGVGGGEYDRVTDEVIRRYYGVEPPTYIVASAALYLLRSTGEWWESGEWNEAKLRDYLRRMRYNPQAFVTSEDGRASDLAARKRRLIREMWKPQADRRALTRDIEATNAALFEMLAQGADVKEMQAALSNSRALNRTFETLTWRAYPFACYDPAALRTLVESAVGIERGESRITESPPRCRT